MEWIPHYTGSDTAEAKRFGMTLYLQRESKTKKLTFWRLSAPHGHMVGLFIGRANFVKGDDGWELFTGGHHVGWANDWKFKYWRHFFRVDWSGSMNNPYHSFTWRFGHLGLGGRTPKWVKSIKERRADREHDRMIQAYFDTHPEYEAYHDIPCPDEEQDDVAETQNKDYKL